MSQGPFQPPQKPKEPATWRDGLLQAPKPAPRPPRDPETGAFREG